jgi:hypothetical protein
MDIDAIFFRRERFTDLDGSSILFDKLKDVVNARGKKLESVFRDDCATNEGDGQPQMESVVGHTC